MKLYFVTGNEGKFKEINSLIEDLLPGKIILKQEKLDLPELDSNDLICISKDKAIKAFNKLNEPVLVDDSGIYFDEYNNFPGPLAKRVFNGLGFKGLKRLLENANIKTGKFITVLSYFDKNLKEPVSFVGELRGIYDFSLIDNTAEEDLKQFSTLPYKYIFKPKGFDKFYSQFNKGESQAISQRAKAVKKFIEWLVR